jgi:hypothetical protein
VDIDEHYISRIYNGLFGEFTFAGKQYKLKITKVYTQGYKWPLSRLIWSLKVKYPRVFAGANFTDRLSIK